MSSGCFGQAFANFSYVQRPNRSAPPPPLIRAPMYSPWTCVGVGRRPAALLEAAAAVLVGVGRRLHDAVERDVVDDLDRAHGVAIRVTENVAPCGSASVACRPIGRSSGPSSTAPPSSGRRLDGRVDVVDPEVDAPAGLVAGEARGDQVARHRLRGLAADEAREAPHHDVDVAHREHVGLPAEDGAVERLGALGVGRGERAHRPGARLVDDLGAAVLAGLGRRRRPRRRGRRARRVRPTPGRSNGSVTIAAARGGRARGGLVGALDPDVRAPGGAGVARDEPAATSRPRSVQTT